MHTLAVVAVLLGAGAAVTFIGARLIERAHPPRGRFIEIGGLRQHVVEIGEQRRRSGCAGNRAAAWRRRQSRRHASCAWRAPRRPPPGHSPRPARPRLERAQRRRGKLTHLSGGDAERGVRSARGRAAPFVVGHSWGGLLALTFALDYPQRVAGLVVIAPPTHPWLGRQHLAQFGLCDPRRRLAVRPHADAAVRRPADRTGFSRRVSAAIVAARLHEAHGGAPAAAA